jgi:Phosphoribosylformimino-5-aminoimidazole carboxamide ribonucleotide (ProFAR) isomerase
MIVYPAIDLRDNKCVRLYKGDFSKQEIFNTSPLNRPKNLNNMALLIYILLI